MKKIVLLASLVTLSASVWANAGFQHSAVKTAKLQTVAEALRAKENALVLLEGYLVKQLDDDEFLFKDATGQVEVEVSPKVWQGQTASPQDKLRVTAKVDKDGNKTELEVVHLIIK